MRAPLLIIIAMSFAAAAACVASSPKAVTGIPNSSTSVTPAQPSATAAFLPPLPPLEAEDASAEAGALVVEVADGGSPAVEVPSARSACNEQAPQDFLIRGNFLKEGAAGNRRAIQYRTDQYGYFKGFGRPGPGARPPSASVVDATFFGLRVKMHSKVVPALACVEEEIHRSCSDHPYSPHALAGIRYRNTYRGGEVTNHAYGIAIDVDPSINTCCGCVPPWNDAPACKRPTKSEYGHMAMPECWVHAFERYGFYWLGHDVLKDTMHFEFLGDPDRIANTAPRAGAP
jgi:D-alanyl-D-alanine carboxypeptidase